MTSSATKIDVAVPRSIEVELGATIRVKAASLPPALLTTLRHAASLHNPAFYDRERRRQSTWDTPRFLRLYDETAEGDLLLPRGMYDRLAPLLQKAEAASLSPLTPAPPGLPRRSSALPHSPPNSRQLTQSCSDTISECLLPHPARARR